MLCKVQPCNLLISTRRIAPRWLLQRGMCVPAQKKDCAINLPTIDPTILPQHDRLCAIVGSLLSQGVAVISHSGDIVMMVDD
jgi:hypothetical protein